jgi:cyclopropane-fatty-acyl-phospholipid synthase
VRIVRAATQRIVFRTLAGLRGGELVIRFPDGRGRRFGDGLGRRVVIDVHRPAAFWSKLARRTRIGFGESYVDGDWDADDPVALFELLSVNLEAAARHPVFRALNRLQEKRPHRPQRQSAAAARDNIYAHYDLGNDLFRLMLDETMTYSCAVWERPDMTLAEAQRAKYRRICEKLHLVAGDHVLEIGCGWGGFAIYAAGEYGCRVTGLTLSPSQASLARERVHEAGLDEFVEILEQDYRHTDGRFTKVASIEMLEAIGLAEHETYFRAIDRFLERGGIAVIQTIAIPDNRFERYRRRRDWIQQYIFPGSQIPSVGAVERAAALTRLGVVGLEEIGPHYADTLKIWRENVEAHVGEVRALGYDERFLRIWRFYLTFCEAAFRVRTLRDVQVVLARPTSAVTAAPAEHGSTQAGSGVETGPVVVQPRRQ